MPQEKTADITRHQITSAISVITNPAHFCDQPQEMQLAWERLKAARGQTVDARRIGQAMHQVETGEERTARTLGLTRGGLARLRARAAAQRAPVVVTFWPQHGGDAA